MRSCTLKPGRICVSIGPADRKRMLTGEPLKSGNLSHYKTSFIIQEKGLMIAKTYQINERV